MKKKDKIKVVNNIKIILFFLYILIFYIFGADPEKIKYSEIILLAFIGLEFLSIVKTGKIKYCIPIIIVFIFSFYCFLSNLWAIDSELAVSRAKTLMILAVFLLVAYNFFSNIEDGEDKLLKIIMYAGTIFSVYVIMYYGIGEYINKLISGERIGTEINNVNAIGLQTSISSIIAIFYGLYDGKKRYFLLSIIPLMVSLGTGSRKVIVLIVLGITLLFILKKEGKVSLIKSAKKIITFAIIVIAFMLILRLPMFSTIYERMEMTMNGVMGKGKFDSSTELRKSYIKAGMDQFFEKPFCGVGIANSSYITMQEVGRTTYLHNNYVELLATTGIIGFCLYYSVYCYIIINCIKMIKTKNKYINVSLVIFLTNMILEYGMVSYYSKSTYIYILIGLITIQKARKESVDEKGN